MRLKPRLGLGIGMILLVCIAQPGQQPADTEYVALPGDFNGDGKTDLLYVPTRSGLPSEIALADQNGIPQPGFQILQPTQFGIRWTLERVRPVIGDFNGDALDDVLLQSKLRDASDLRLIPVADLAVGSHGSLNLGELTDEEAIYRRADHRHSA